MELIETLYDCCCLGVALHKINVLHVNKCIPLSVIAVPQINRIVLTVPGKLNVFRVRENIPKLKPVVWRLPRLTSVTAHWSVG